MPDVARELEREDAVSLRKVYNNFPLTETASRTCAASSTKPPPAPSKATNAPPNRQAASACSFRSLVGLDRYAASEAFGSFLDGKQFNATRIEFINLVFDDLATNRNVPQPGSMRALH